MLIPHGDDKLLVNDIIFILAKTKDMMKIERLLGTERKRAERVMILGGGFTGYHLAKILEERRYSVKIIEKEYKRCRDLSNTLNNTLVLHGDAADIDLLKSEGAGDADVFVCLTDDDKLNLLVSLIVKHLGAKKTIAQVRRSDYITLMESVGIDVGISPRTLTANAILRFINRGNNVVSVTLLSDDKAEMLEFIVSQQSKIANKKLKDLNFPNGAIIGTIYRNNKMLIPKGEEYLKPNDVVTVFSLPKSSSRIIDYFVV
jgi:trk system potassium uptake protein TrkA